MKYLLAAIREILHNYRIRQAIKKIFPDTTIETYVTIKGNLNNLHLGRHVAIQSGTVLHLGGMSWCQNEGMLEIGEDSVISPNCVIYGCGPGGVRIGKKFDCAPNVGIFSSRTDYHIGADHHIFAPVIIGDDVTVFANCVISPGVTIGNKVTIAAGSVVTTDLPDNCLAGGSPAKVLKTNVR